jgi:rubredoxin---NAD+ reductase
VNVTRTAPAGAPWLQFICRVCGLIYDERLGDADSGLAAGTRFADIPEDWACPICGVTKADFEPHVPTTLPTRAPAVPVVAPRRAGLVVVGAGRAGWQLVQALRDGGYVAPITLVTACSGDLYDKPQLSVAVARHLPVTGLVRETASAAAVRLGVRLLAHTHAVAIDAPRQRLRTTRGTLRWQQLVLAQGAMPALPPQLAPAHVWRINELAAYSALRTQLDGSVQRLAIIGAGLVGCELANDLALAGHHITLLDVQPLPLAAHLPALAGQRLLQAWQGLPICFIGAVQVAAVDAHSGAAAAWCVRLQDGRSVEVDHVIAATGLRTPGRLATSAGLAFDSAAGGVIVDAQGQTSVAGIYALGDCAVVAGRASRFIEPISRQVAAIAARLLGRDGSHATGPAAHSAELLRVKTSALTITVKRWAHGPGHWRSERDDAQGLHMAQHGADGQLLARLHAQLAASSTCQIRRW